MISKAVLLYVAVVAVLTTTAFAEEFAETTMEAPPRNLMQKRKNILDTNEIYLIHTVVWITAFLIATL